MAKERRFPEEWEAQRPVLHYPDESDEVTGDVLEIGPGRGDMLLWLAQQHPEKSFVAIEMMLSRFRKLVKRIERLQLTNVRVMRGNARIILPRFFKSPSFETIYLLFPDPWPKERHAFHRLLSADILATCSSILREGGELIFATDHEPYAQWVATNASQMPTLINLGAPFSQNPALIPNPDRTYFENKWREEGRHIYFVHLRKRSTL